MKKFGFVTTLASLLLVVPGVAPGAVEAVAAQSGDSIAEASPPSVELPADLARVLRDYEGHWERGEADLLSRLFVEEGLIVRDGRWLRGRDAIRRAYESASGPLRLRAIAFGAGGDAGYIVGAYGYGDGVAPRDRGLFVLTLRRESSGRWLIVSDVDRPSVPDAESAMDPPPPAGTDPELEARQAEVARAGAHVMPFDLDRTTHVFEPVEDGGVQTVVSDDGDPEQIALIRSHLAEEAARFARGDFHDPAMIHGEDMAGMHALVMGHDRLSITYRDVPRGGEIRYRTGDPELVSAVHAWFEAQLADHGSHAHSGHE